MSETEKVPEFKIPKQLTRVPEPAYGAMLQAVMREGDVDSETAERLVCAALLPLMLMPRHPAPGLGDGLYCGWAYATPDGRLVYCDSEGTLDEVGDVVPHSAYADPGEHYSSEHDFTWPEADPRAFHWDTWNEAL